MTTDNATSASDAPIPTESGSDDSAEMTMDEVPSWEELGLSPEVRQALGDLGYLRPMPVQAAVYQHLRAGKDMMVQARTGTGKTAAFGIPTVENIKDDDEGVKALILTPTRELALQVAEELGRIASFKTINVVPVYGGAPIKKQIDQLAAGAQVVAGTPGRVLDHIRRGTLSTKGIRMLVLDECDEMLSMGFQEEIENIIDRLPSKEQRQTLLFSATIPDAIERIARKHLTDPEKIQLSTGGISVDEIDHGYYIVNGIGRMRDLMKVIAVENPESAIIFCNTRDETSTVAKFLSRHGYDAEAISSDLSQKDRERVMKRMRDKNLRFLVATDIAARGIDISDLPYVFNYTFPESAEVYVHRTGRTGRAGKRGIALSLVGPREIGAFYYLKLLYKIRPEERELPGNEVIAASLEGDKVRRLTQRVSEDPGEEYRNMARRLWESTDGERVVGALLKRLASGAMNPQARRQTSDTDAPTDEDRRDAAEADDGRRDQRRRRDRDRDRDGARAPRRERPERRDRDDEALADGEGRRRRRRRDRSDDARRESDEPVAELEADPMAEAAAASAAEPADVAEAVTAENDDAQPEEGRRKRRRSRRRRDRRDSDAEVTKSDEPASDVDEDDAEPAVAAAPAPAKTERSGKDTRNERPKRGSKKAKAKASTDDDKEFWEAWADEKQARAGSKSEADEPATEATASTDDDPMNGDAAATVRLYVNIGKREEITADDVRDLLAQGLSEDAAERIGAVALRNTHSYVRVPEDLADIVISGAEGKSYKDRDVVVERARR